ncbi:MAG: oligosaccharide flippase family protein [Bacteroidales bacterium]|jgi:O-antigen/teichoic acid export membrane protein|nr:oligosaccharide flippase family protein [Bacteroidales bacterium]
MNSDIITQALTFVARSVHTDIFKRFLKVFSVDFLVRGGNFLLIFVFTAIMNQKEFGIYGYLYSFAMVMSGIVGFGFNVAMTKNYTDTIIHRNERLKDMLFTMTTSMILLLTIAIFAIYCTGTDKTFFVLMNNDSQTVFNYSNYRLYTAIAIISTVFTSYLTYYFVSAEKIKSIQRFNLLRFFLANGIAIIVILTSDRDSAMLRLAATYLTELLLTVMFGKMFLARGKFDWFFLKKALKIGLPIMGTSVVYAITNFGDKYFTMRYCGVEQFAVYNLAILIAMILIIVFQSFNFIWLPLFMKEQDLRLQRKKMKRFSLIIFLVFSVLSVLIWFGVMLLLNVGLLNAEYKGILQLLPPLLASQIAISLAQLYINYMTYFEKTHIQFVFGVFVSAVAIGLYSFSVKYFGVMGICYSLLAVNVISFVFYFFRSGYYVANRL